MACGARSGLKLLQLMLLMRVFPGLNGLWSPFGIETYRITTVALRGRQVEASSSRRPKKRRRLHQMSVKGRSGLLQGGDGQRLRRAQPQVVGVTADGAMSAPGGPGQALDLAMGGQPTLFSHKAKRREGRQPGKPCRGIWLKGQQTARGADHHVGPLNPKFNER